MVKDLFPGGKYRRLAEKPVTLLLLFAAFVLVYLISRVQQWDTLVFAVLLFLCMDAHEDATDTPWLRFLPVGLLLLAVPYYIFKHANDVWWDVAAWQMNSVAHLFHWDDLFRKIPLNDPIFLQNLYSHPYLTKFMRWVYSYGFAFCIWAAVIRSFLARDWRKMLHYTLATHLLQTPLIVPFYNSIELHEVWWVLGRPDPFHRPELLTAAQVQLSAQNCFPSMHTSVAFAVMLLALREKGVVFKWGMVAYTGAIIFSTMYLQIHWTIDVVAGLAFGYGIAKLSDWIMAKVSILRRPSTAVRTSTQDPASDTLVP